MYVDSRVSKLTDYCNRKSAKGMARKYNREYYLGLQKTEIYDVQYCIYIFYDMKGKELYKLKILESLFILKSTI